MRKIFCFMISICLTALLLPDYFVLRGTDLSIPLVECTCEYKSDWMEVYAKDIYRNIQTSYGLPYFQKVLYLRTPFDSRQFFLMENSYFIDSEKGSVYVVGNDEATGSFVSIYCYQPGEHAKGEILVDGVKVLSASLVEEWIGDAHCLTTGSFDCTGGFTSLFLQVHEFTSKRGNVILKGEASGILKESGQTYYIDWELNDTTGETKVTPCHLKIYDRKKDSEIFTACENAYDLVEQGDWSVVAPFEGMKHVIERKTLLWRRADVNGDGLPELCSLYNAYSEEKNIIPIDYIFTYADGQVTLVYDDLNDMTEYLFLGSNGNLVYDCSNFGQVAEGLYSQYQFDEKWNLKCLSHLEIHGFFEDNVYDEEEISYLKKAFPSTYGVRGSGFYCFRSRPKSAQELKQNKDQTYWVNEEISKEEFLKAYRQMTGFDFFEENEFLFPPF